MPLTFLLCDDHVIFREALALLLGKQPGWRVVAQAESGSEAVRLADELKPDVAVLDVAMPGVSGIDVAARICASSPNTRIVALSMYGDPFYRQEMFGAGAKAYVLKNEASAELVRAIHAVLRGETYLSQALQNQPTLPPPGSAKLRSTKLTARERDVLHLLVQGQRTRSIAETLGLSSKTVEIYRSRVMLKLGANNLVELVKHAIRAGLVSDK